jgi:hypothetical protein
MTPAHRLLISLTIHSKLPAGELALLLLICRRKKAYNCSIGKDYAKIISTLLITVVRSDRVPVPTKIVRAWELPPETNIDLDCRSSTKEHGGSSLLCCSKLIGRGQDDLKVGGSVRPWQMQEVKMIQSILCSSLGLSYSGNVLQKEGLAYAWTVGDLARALTLCCWQLDLCKESSRSMERCFKINEVRIVSTLKYSTVTPVTSGHVCSSIQNFATRLPVHAILASVFVSRSRMGGPLFG